MRRTTLLRRRLGQNRAALAAVVTTLVLSLLVVAALQLFAAAIADSSVRGTVRAADTARRSIAVDLPLRAGDLRDKRAALVAAAAPLTRHTVDEAAIATSMGLRGGNATDRLQLADIPGLAGRSRLVAGTWPNGAGRPLEVAVSEATAAALGWRVGTRSSLLDLIERDAPATSVRVVGIFRPTDAANPLWVDAPLALTGRAVSTYTTYGPLVVGAGIFEGDLGSGATARWRISVPDTLLDMQGAPEVIGEVDQVLRRLADDPALRGANVTTDLPAVLRGAVDLGRRTAVTLWTPAILLLLLGGVSLALAAVQLAGLRAPEVRLIRARGASDAQVGTLAFAESFLLVGSAVVLAAIGAPLLAGRLSAAAGLDAASVRFGSALPSAVLWRPLLAGGTLAILIMVTAALREGRLLTDSGVPGAGNRVVTALASSGTDLVLIVLGALGVLQLRRYNLATTPGVDPLTVVAPALVVGGLAVVALRSIPLLARAGAGLATRSPGMPLAWGGWQVARRVHGQGGAILLIVLAMSMGSMALAQSSTTERALIDQSGFEAGAPLRVGVGPELYGATWLNAAYGRISGAPDRAMAAYRETVQVGGRAGVTFLGVGQDPGAVVDIRSDLVEGSWKALTAELRPHGTASAGIAIPGSPQQLTLRIKVSVPPEVSVGFNSVTGTAILRDASGLWSAIPTGPLAVDGPEDFVLRLDSPSGSPGYPLSLVGLSVDSGLFSWLSAEDMGGFQVQVLAATADGNPVPGLDRLTRSMSGPSLVLSAPLPRVDSVPVIVTRRVADIARQPVGGSFGFSVGGGRVQATIVGIVEALPTATVPDLGVVADLPTLQLALANPAGEGAGIRALSPREWWLAPADPNAARAALARAPRLQASVADAGAILAARRDASVNAGMRAAMRLVTAAALVLAALGFAAATAAAGAARRHDGVILAALGMPPRTLRRVLVLERVTVIVLAVTVGLAAGGFAARLVAALLVGGDGHPQVPPVRTVAQPVTLALFAGCVAVALTLVAAVVLSRTEKDLPGALRAGDRP